MQSIFDDERRGDRPIAPYPAGRGAIGPGRRRDRLVMRPASPRRPLLALTQRRSRQTRNLTAD